MLASKSISVLKCEDIIFSLLVCVYVCVCEFSSGIAQLNYEIDYDIECTNEIDEYTH